MKTNISLKSLVARLQKTLKRFHVVIFVLLALGGLSAAVYFVNDVLVTSTQAAESDLSESTAIDQATIDKIDTFHTSTSSNVPSFERQTGRQSPFTE